MVIAYRLNCRICADYLIVLGCDLVTNLQEWVVRPISLKLSGELFDVVCYLPCNWYGVLKSFFFMYVYVGLC